MVSLLYFRRCYFCKVKRCIQRSKSSPRVTLVQIIEKSDQPRKQPRGTRIPQIHNNLTKLKSCFHRLIRSQNKSIIRGRLFLFIDPKREMTSGGVVEDEKNRSVATDYQHQQQPPHPPPFQGVSNYPPPQQQPPPPGYPQPAQPYVSGNFLFHVFNGQHVEMIRSAVGFFFFLCLFIFFSFLDIFHRISFW